MRPRNTLLLLVAVALASFAFWVLELREGARPAGETTEQHVFAGLAAKDVHWIEIDQGDGSTVRIERSGEEWRLTHPVAAAADRFQADAVASALVDLASETVYDSAAAEAAQRPEPLESYGLTRAPRVRFEASGKPYALRIGDPSPVSGNTYVADAEAKRIFAAPSWRVNAITKTAQELREARLAIFERDNLEKLTLAWAGGGATLAKGDKGWRVIAPLDDAADDGTVQSLISDLQGLRAEAFLDAPAPDEELGLDAPAYRVELFLKGVQAPLELRVGAKRESGRLAARGPAGAVEVAASQLERLPHEVAALRDKRLAEFASLDAKRFTLSFVAPDGAKLEVKGAHAESGWTTEPPMAQGLASALVAELAMLEGTGIAADAVGRAERAALGLEPPRVAILVFGEADKLLAEVRIGIAREGQGIAALRADRPIVYWIAPSLGEQIPLDLASFRAKFAAAPAAKPAPDAAKPAT